jgi:hypothetical protein
LRTTFTFYFLGSDIPACYLILLWLFPLSLWRLGHKVVAADYLVSVFSAPVRLNMAFPLSLNLSQKSISNEDSLAYSDRREGKIKEWQKL